MKEHLFDRRLGLPEDTCQELFESDIAETSRIKTERIAEGLQLRYSTDQSAIGRLAR